MRRDVAMLPAGGYLFLAFKVRFHSSPMYRLYSLNLDRRITPVSVSIAYIFVPGHVQILTLSLAGIMHCHIAW